MGGKKREQLFAACKEKNEELALELLRKRKLSKGGINYSRQSENQKGWATRCSTLHLAVQGNLLGVVQEMLQDSRLNINQKDSRGETAFYYACNEGFTNIVEEFLKQSELEVNMLGEFTTLSGEKSQNYTSPLHVALANRHFDITNILLNDERVDINTRGYLGTPLQEACRRSNLDVLEILLSNNRIDVNGVCESCHQPPLYVAVLQSTPEVVERLLSDNRIDATQEVEDILDKTRMIYTSAADLDYHHYRERSKKGKFTALDAAAFHNKWDMAKIILLSRKTRPSSYLIKKVKRTKQTELHELCKSARS